MGNITLRQVRNARCAGQVGSVDRDLDLDLDRVRCGVEERISAWSDMERLGYTLWVEARRGEVNKRR